VDKPSLTISYTPDEALIILGSLLRSAYMAAAAIIDKHCQDYFVENMKEFEVCERTITQLVAYLKENNVEFCGSPNYFEYLVYRKYIRDDSMFVKDLERILEPRLKMEEAVINNVLKLVD
jgi:hypothetical protein